MTLVGLYLLLGAGAGLIAGLFGLGGGVIIVPALIFTFAAQGIPDTVATHMAIATSLLSIVATSTGSIYEFNRRGEVLWDIVRVWGVGLALGACLGVALASDMNGELLQRLFSVFLLLVGFKMLLRVNPNGDRALPGKVGLVSVGGVIGGLSAMLGVGGGTLSVPFFRWCQFSMPRAVAMAGTGGFILALFGALMNVYKGWGEPDLPEWSLGYIYLPAFIGIVASSIWFARLGAKLAIHLPDLLLQRAFAFVLFLIAYLLMAG